MRRPAALALVVALVVGPGAPPDLAGQRPTDRFGAPDSVARDSMNVPSPEVQPRMRDAVGGGALVGALIGMGVSYVACAIDRIPEEQSTSYDDEEEDGIACHPTVWTTVPPFVGAAAGAVLGLFTYTLGRIGEALGAESPPGHGSQEETP